MKITPVTIGSAPADKAMSKLRDTLDLPKTKTKRFTPEAEKTFLSKPVIISIPANKLSDTVNIVDENVTLALLEQSVSISPIGNVSYIGNIPANELSEIDINIFFVSASEDQKTIDSLSNALSIAPNIKTDSTTGKIDYSLLDAEMIASLPVGKKVSDYIKNVRKHPIKNILSVTTRSTKKVGGKVND